MNDLRQLLHAYQTGEATPAELSELSERIRTNPGDARAAAAWMLMTSDLAETLGANRETPASQSPARAASAGRINRLRISPSLAVAAAILLAAAAFVVYLFASGSQHSAPARSDKPIATLIDTDTDVYVDDDIANPGSEYKPGRYMIQSGSADLQLTSGASVRMIGFTDLSMRTAMWSSLNRGSAVFNCPKSAVGYTVALPGDVKVVDLGTRFAVRVDDAGSAVVQVLEGRVRIDTPTGSHELTAGAAHEILEGVSTPMSDLNRLVVAPPAPPVDPAVFASAIRELGPVAYWAFEDRDSDGFIDAVGGRLATIENAITIGGVPGNRNLSLDGSGHLAVDGDATLNAPGRQLSISAWVLLESTDHQAIVHKWSGAPGYSLEIFQDKPSFVVAFAGQPATVVHVKADDPMPTDRWVHLVGVCDGSTVSIYVDGRLVAAMAVPGIDAIVNESRGPVTIGRRSDKPDGALRGAIDDVAVFAHSLSSEQITQLYHAKPTGDGVATSREKLHPESETADR